jgi:hypothetical protein
MIEIAAGIAVEKTISSMTSCALPGGRAERQQSVIGCVLRMTLAVCFAGARGQRLNVWRAAA